LLKFLFKLPHLYILMEMWHKLTHCGAAYLRLSVDYEEIFMTFYTVWIVD